MTRGKFLAVLGDTEYIDRTAIATHDAEQRAEIARLREALQALMDVQNGPPLEKYREAWERAMEHADRLLKETP